MHVFARDETVPQSQWHIQLLVARTFGLIGVGIVATYGLAVRSFTVLSVGAMVGAASLLFGALLGFLFGIPRSTYYPSEGASSPEDQSTQNPQVASVNVNSPLIRANTNLEQISDWLTKILVGVSLTQIPAIGNAARVLISEVAAGMTPDLKIGEGPSPEARSIAGGIIAYFLAIGFLMGFIVTRTSLPKIFAQADAEALRLRMAQAEQVNKRAEDTVERLARETPALQPDNDLLTGRLGNQRLASDHR
jgi:hypothetical protein